MRIVFMGTPRAAVPSLERLLEDGHEIAAVYTQPDRPSGRGNKIIFSPVKEFAQRHGLTVVQPVKIRTPDAFDEFKAFNADVAVVVAYGRILPDAFLTAFTRGAINLHFSLLPKYRGAAPVNWAIVNGETETGVTTMQMDAGLDTGPILRQELTAIGPNETSVALMERLALMGAEVLSDTFANLDQIEPQNQDNEKATIAPIMKRDDGLIDWAMTATKISNRIRGFQPFPTAFTFRGGLKLTLWNAAACSSDLAVGLPGTVIEANGDDLLVSCGGGTLLRIEELQPEGKRRMPTRDFLNGVRLTEGDRFGT